MTRFLKMMTWMFAGGALVGAVLPEGLRLNEFMASNDWVHPDNADFDDYSDWIELHNPTDAPIDLADYFLTDNLKAPAKWAFAAGTTIPAQGFLVVRADGFDAAPGETHTREFSPWDTFTTIRHHTNFKLSAAGEELGLFYLDGTIEDLAFSPSGASWRYLDDGSDPGADWFQPSYADSSWNSGPAQLGYGDGDEATVVSYGSDSSDKHPTTYFRREFEIADPIGLSQCSGRLLADDGAIVYLNGTEILRLRMPEGEVGSETYALALGPEGVFDLFDVSPELIQSGTNTIAVEVHQQNGSSSDISFDLELSGRFFDGRAMLIDQVVFGPQYPNVSWGRQPGADDAWAYFGEATPGTANTTIATSVAQPTAAVAYSHTGGFYDDAPTVSLTTADASATIHYTLDGSRPGSDSPTYEMPISIDTTTVVRARAFASGLLPGPIATRTFFVDEPESALPVISLAVEPAEFFDTTLGIYSNIYKGREAAIHLEYYDATGALGFAVGAGAKIAGENIWRFAQKPLTVTLRGKFGSDEIAYPLFDNERTGFFEQFVLRNGGDNWPNAMLRDALTPFLLQGQSSADVQNYRPVVVYLNGHYWGVYNLREKLDNRYFQTHHHLNAGTYDYLEYGHVEGGAVVLLVEEGDADGFNTLEADALSLDPASSDYFAEMATRIEMDTFIDFVVAEDFVNNTSWKHNREFWGDRRPGGKWHWIVPDLDRGFNPARVNASLLDDMQADFPLFGRLAANREFRERCAQRYAAHLGSTLHPARISDLVDQLDAEVRLEIARHIERWKDEGGIASMVSRDGELAEIKTFAVDRHPKVRQGIANHLGFTETAELTISIEPAAAGRVLVQGVPLLPEYSDTLQMYRDVPLDLTAQPAPGYAFAGWSDGLGAEAQVTLTLAGNQTLVATFVASDETVLPAVIDADRTLMAADSPYTSAGSVVVSPGTTLTINAGVTVRFPAEADLLVYGALIVEGREDQPVTIEARDANRPWGVLALVDGTASSQVAHLVVRDASVGFDPVNLHAAFTSLRSTLVLEDSDIESPATFYALDGDTTVRTSRFFTPYTGDGIHLKGGTGLVEGCDFRGNEAPDTDAIDFDGVVNGIIRGNRIYAFSGFNSDGIDVGEGTLDLLIENNLIYHCSDKGISVGQGSVARVERNLIVGCQLGVGVKDAGSRAIVDQGTFVNNAIGLAAFEKNLGAGGGEVVATNSIISQSKEAPVSADALSSVAITYSLSDTEVLTGEGNLLADPGFNDPAIYDFSLTIDSPAIDAGDPHHAPASDGTRIDMGADYHYDLQHREFYPANLIVFNEILAHSHDEAPDWIELYNTSGAPVDIGGWYLSDNEDDLQKYRIADGTVIPANGYLVYYQHTHFGEGSGDPGSLTPFALSENGESVFLYGPGDGVFLDYLESEIFRASDTGISLGRHYKASTGTFNFVAMANPTPGAANSLPLVSPVVISEIMYRPVDGDAEFIELYNRSSTPVTLYDSEVGLPWRFVDGIEYDFPASPALVMAAGERLVLVADAAVFAANYSVPFGTRVLTWTSGGLSNGGERIELARPGDLDSDLVRQYIRVERVNYEDVAPWPLSADGLGDALHRLDASAYANDVANWVAAPPTPGAPATAELGSFANFVAGHSLPAGQDGPLDDPDHDGISNLIEYLWGLLPMELDFAPAPLFESIDAATIRVTFPLAAGLTDLAWSLETSSTLTADDWIPATGMNLQIMPKEVWVQLDMPRGAVPQFFRFRANLVE